MISLFRRLVSGRGAAIENSVHFKDFGALSAQAKYEKLLEGGVFLLWLTAAALSVIRLFYPEDGNTSGWDYAVYSSLWLFSIALLGLSIVKLPGEKRKWTVGLAIAFLLLAYTSYRLISMVLISGSG